MAKIASGQDNTSKINHSNIFKLPYLYYLIRSKLNKGLHFVLKHKLEVLFVFWMQAKKEKAS